MRSKTGRILLLWLLAAVSLAASAQHVSLRNNLLYDATLTPNIGIEADMGNRWTVGVDMGLRPWPTDDQALRKWRHVLVAPEVRHWRVPAAWLRMPRADSLFRNHATFWGMNIVYSHFNVSNVRFPLGLYRDVRHHRRQGDLAALGAFWGYTWRMTPLFRMETEIGLLVGYAWTKRYNCDHCGTYWGHYDTSFLMPKIALNIVLDPQRRATPPAPAVLPEPLTRPEPELPAEPSVAETHEEPLPEPAAPTAIDTLMQRYPFVADITSYQPYDSTRVLRKEKGLLYVHFPVGRAAISPAFRSNAEALESIVDITRQILADSTAHLRLIQVIGLASVEGPEHRNMLLAQQRAEALRDYVQQHVPQATDDHFELACGGEAWTELLSQLSDELNLCRQNGNTQRAAIVEQAIDIIRSTPNLALREKRLKRLDGGRLYRYISNTLLPDQRNSGYLRIYIERQSK